MPFTLETISKIKKLMEELSDSPESYQDTIVEVKPSSASTDAPAVRPTKCQQADCKAKIRISDFACKCSKYYCGTHRYPEVHMCSVDFQTLGKGTLEKQLVKTVSVKVDQI